LKNSGHFLTGRNLLIISLSGLIIGLSGCAHLPFSKKQTKSPENLDPNERKIKRIAVAYRNLGTDEVKAFMPLEDFHAASTMKTPVMFQLFKMRDEGKLNLSDSVTVTNEFRSILDGSGYTLTVSPEDGDGLYLKLGRNVAIRDLIEKMITRSSNLATNILIEIADPVKIAETMKQIDAFGVFVLRGVEDIKAYEAGLSNRTTAGGMMNMMTAVYRSNRVADTSRQEMIDILAAQHFNDMIPKGLPDGIKVAHKTGSITRIAHDAAIVFPPNADPYVLVILTSGYDDNTEAQALGARISERIYAYHMNTEPNKIIDISDLVPKIEVK